MSICTTTATTTATDITSSGYYINSNITTPSITTNGTVQWNNSIKWNDLINWDDIGVVTTINNIYNTIKDEKTVKEDNKMNYNFGPYTNNQIKLSPYGLAIKNKMGNYVSYDRKEKCLRDVNIFNFEIDTSKIFYTIPKAINEVKIGDFILHNSVPVFVDSIEKNRFKVINPVEGSEMIILPTKSPFGFDYITTIISLTDFLPAAQEDNPFGNLLPFLISGKDNNIGLILALNSDIKDIDPFMLMALTNNNDSLNALILMQMMNQKKKSQAEKVKTIKAVMNKKHASYGPGIEDKDE